MKGCDFSMGIYTEKRDQLIEKIKGLEKRIASDTAKKKTLEDKLKEVSRLFIGLSNNMWIYPGGDAGRKLDKNIEWAERIKSILRIASNASNDDDSKPVISDKEFDEVYN